MSTNVKSNITTNNILESFYHTVIKKENEVSIRVKEHGKWTSITWRDYFRKVVDLVGGLKKLGVKKGDRVCIFSKSRFEWSVSDLAILACGAITVPIYESSTADQAEYIINNCEAKVLFLEEKNQLAKITSRIAGIPSLKQIIVYDFADIKREEGIYSFEEIILLGSGEGEEIFHQNRAALTRGEEASYVYTSGTTGHPKGAILTHGNFIAELEALGQRLDFEDDIESLLFLPLAHILARVVHMAHVHYGFIQAYAESIDKLIDNIAEVRPHLMASVPRIFEKVHGTVMHNLESASPFKKKIFNWAVGVGNEVTQKELKGSSPSLLLSFQNKLAHKLVFSKLHQKLGGRIRYFISGGAPLSKDIGDFFMAAGFKIYEGYGLTETTAAVAVNSKKGVKMGTVGQPLPGVEIKIAGDGEILVRGPVVFKGYYKRPEATHEALNSEGWFHTGDIGVIDDEGFVKITDRKKDIIVTAAGKNIAPQNIENFIKTDPLISQVMIHGDKRKFLSALVTLNKDEIVKYAKLQNIHFSNYSDLIKQHQIFSLIKNRIEDKNRQLAKYETIKKFAILENDFSVETGELTPTLKVKRKFTSEKYKNIIDDFYQE